ncbi:sulfatase-like hydrolase/transferase [Niabella aurantiaca]|uniref:sulfatase-like hydrolase/transferase n=1 Tax=Niabella aurantiaca TaxID=379900 RepID=UPI00035E7DBF|nr:sulfatase-like hydrolase/transferase [Niabella aurantiaca]
MRFRIFLLWLLSGVAYASHAQHAAAVTTQNKRSNILWLVTEDISPYLSFYGDSTALTPNLDRLAREGVVYTNAFSTAGVCAPSRSAIITGMYASSIGTDNMRTLADVPIPGIESYSAVLPPEVKMFTEYLRKAGYYCSNNAKQDYQFQAPLSGWDESNRNAHWRNRKPGQPFFAVFNFDVTHESQVWKRKNKPLLVDPARIKLPPYYPESPVIRKDMARMYSNIMVMDSQVGVMLKQLEEDGLLEQTIIFFYSDNGGPLPRGKREIYESGIHLPMVVRYPNRVNAGKRDDRLVSYVDLAPTVLSLAGVNVPAYMQGQAFEGKQRQKERQYVFAARDRMDTAYDRVRTVRDLQFQYVKNFQPEKPFIQNITYRMSMDLMKELLRLHDAGGLNAVQQLWFRKKKPVEELYDVIADPDNLHDLAGDPKYAGKLKELRAVLKQWMRTTGDKGFIPERELIRQMWGGKDAPPETAPPVCTLKKGQLILESPTPGASLSWQWVDAGAAPVKNHWKVYNGPLEVQKGKRLVAIAERIGYISSPVITKDF